jgi:nitroreductase
MIDNPILRAIRERRSVRNFSAEPVTDEQLEAILEAGRWAPSGRNSQPWDFVVVRDPDLRAEIGSVLKRVTWAWGGLSAAPVLIVVAVNKSQDPDHFVEDGAVAAQNLCLAARSLGLASSWAGVHARGTRRGTRRSTADRLLRSLLSLPRTHRVIAVVPVGTAGREVTSSRRPLAEMVHHDRYQFSPDQAPVAVPQVASHPEEGTQELPKPSTRRSLTEPGKLV